MATINSVILGAPVARYGQPFNDRAVARLLPPESASIDEVSLQVVLAAATLERWRVPKGSPT